jgi:hypothetical protein
MEGNLTPPPVEIAAQPKISAGWKIAAKPKISDV